SQLFYFASYFPKLCLLSFPTRRSSELPITVEKLHSKLILCAHGLVKVIPETLLIIVPAPLSVPLPQKTMNKPPKYKWRLLIREKDRKSTRLNSSHVKKSYTVFCLKKKK